MAFSEDQMLKAINQEGVVKASVDKIKEACKALQRETGCPEEDVDDLLNFLAGRWS
ncbi:hypothetical protein [Prochlorococcus sp. MIT 1223]|uniref:hypothetical protein n=1 Tax=Prochlorococcus sp. MIT 1223 TaxID=3096217 RepID=UPI002A74B2EE|nr:hypothetical protein [Prochlorococcus sp. MIT 1223]